MNHSHQVGLRAFPTTFRSEGPPAPLFWFPPFLPSAALSVGRSLWRGHFRMLGESMFPFDVRVGSSFLPFLSRSPSGWLASKVGNNEDSPAPVRSSEIARANRDR